MGDLILNYRACGAECREDWLRMLAHDNGLPLVAVQQLADELGEREDFGAMMMGAISVPLFTLFGLDGLRLRVDDCKPKLLITNTEKSAIAHQIDDDQQTAVRGRPGDLDTPSRRQRRCSKRRVPRQSAGAWACRRPQW